MILCLLILSVGQRSKFQWRYNGSFWIACFDLGCLVDIRRMITIIVAYDENRVIGNNGTIPWRIPEDFKHFKETTIGCPCIMGRRTWDSLPEMFKPLPKRPNIVVTTKTYEMSLEDTSGYKSGLQRDCVWCPFNQPSLTYVSSLERAIEFCKVSYPEKEIFIIGGSQIYNQALSNNLVDRILASEVKGTHDGDTFFPELPIQGMELAKSQSVIRELNDFRIVEYVL